MATKAKKQDTSATVGDALAEAYAQVAGSDSDETTATVIEEAQVPAAKPPLTAAADLDEGLSGLSVQVARTALQRALATVKPAVSTKSTLPILSHVLLRRTSNPSRLSLSATNTEIALIHDMPLDGVMPEDGVTTLPAGIFADLVNSIPADEMVKLTVNGLTHQAKIEARRSRATLRSMNPVEFPSLPIEQFAEQTPVRLDAKALRLLIESVAGAAAKDDARPVFTAVLFEFNEGLVTAAAADSFRLAKMSVKADVPAAFVGREVLIPARSLATLAGVLPVEADVELVLSAQGTSVLFRASHEQCVTTLIANLIQGKFPAYRQIIPLAMNSDTIARVNRKAAQAALKAVKLFARDNANIVRLNLDAEAKTLTFSATADDIGDASQIVDGVDVEGDSIAVILNILYLQDALAMLTGEHAALRIKPPTGTSATSDKPVAIVAPDGEPAQVEHFMGVLMPMHSVK